MASPIDGIRRQLCCRGRVESFQREFGLLGPILHTELSVQSEREVELLAGIRGIAKRSMQLA